MKTKLVEITKDDTGWKGTWYRKGERHFVRQDEQWPVVMLCRWRALDFNGGIHERDCRVMRGPVAWLRCVVRNMRHNDAVKPRSEAESA